MAATNKTTLKGYFNTGDTPTEAQFANLIDSSPNIIDDFADQYVKVEVSSAEVLTLNSAPIELVAAPGAGKVVIPVNVFIEYNYISSAYATNTNMYVIIGASVFLIDFAGLINGVADKNTIGRPSSDDIIANTAIELNVATGNPTAGDGTLTVHVWYKEVTL